jgi:peptidyl-prolyl cis-trans isomerase C
MLDELITKKILIQEAQKQNFDKDRAFMKEIERYWEQALLKLLLKKRSDELGRGIEVKESEVMEAYGQMIAEEGPAVEPYDKVAPEIRNELRKKKIQQAFDKWLVDLRFKSKLKVYEENLKEVEIE